MIHHRPIVMARKPLAGTVAANVMRWGVGALNIGATRIGTDAGWSYPNGPGGSEPHHMERGEPKGDGRQPMQARAGRWPSNLLLSDPELFDVANKGVVGSGAVLGVSKGGNSTQIDVGSGRYNWNNGTRQTEPDGIDPGYGDSGGYSRFFLIPGQDLMRHLVRLVTPKGGVTADPFGSDSIAAASEAEGMIHHGDCIEVMAQMAENSVDAIVTDPPYGLGFMGKSWDTPGMTQRTAVQVNSILPAGGQAAVEWNPHPYQAWCTEWAREAFRVAKPGAYLLAFGGTRTVHRLACAIEDAGWEIRDELIWVYASGFPKSLDVSKALDKAAGAEREVSGPNRYASRAAKDPGIFQQAVKIDQTAPATDLAKQWEGWGTALKPAHEPIVMARKPLVGSVAANVTRYGTGALNIDGTRIGTDAGWSYPNGPGGSEPHHMERGEPKGDGREPMQAQAGRWPSNLLLSDAELFDVANPGVVGSGVVTNSAVQEHEHHWVTNFDKTSCLICGKVKREKPKKGGPSVSAYGDGLNMPIPNGEPYGDSGGYSRFFIVPKSARADREPVLRGQLERQDGGAYAGGAGLPGRTQIDGQWVQTPIEQRKPRENAHPTVKPTDLMRHLVRLVTPPGGTVLDCFLGSGSTALACEMEGFAWIGIEKEAEYVAIAEARLNGVQRGLGLDVPAPTSSYRPPAKMPKARWPKANSAEVFDSFTDKPSIITEEP